ncbi:transcriptional regulator family: Fungal Specific TF [Paecilomyces variotii]|uniref:Putative C6 transcription factor n=1 Tax=Byssochlamys spectabilis TaxID=264951 RepID=A0A443HRD5_BYSSP|nr:putative C6 transcription factor [Paecilomyces variotii]KAJ9199138.1 transcriptional regulator family: Fungal Specific TF [Paecilomyces variotii]KAJ9199239.1 transcriptional regulator family: Fungal Specific TF [Paecilomyces variotii]KAJ9213484.1 transcriptional regulator family: Fungal Specific TF [Paecilomyces variotii]KAJ9233531.1 transcriptional regulator family: Fungal Specific TF [Paecilomyces variotii]KAJ9241003.1 transcriptional regulator family: Fungal Specific TF [Paecilomyces var
MSSSNRSRVAKRMHQACENCRRKKTRCPGERPSCSTCTRLYQVCNYAGTSAQSDQRQPLGGQLDMEGRLAQLEEKMQLMLERAIPQPSVRGRTPQSNTRRSFSHQTTPESPAHQMPGTAASSNSDSLPPRDVVFDVVQQYFTYCHRQPLWLFDDNDIPSLVNCTEELIFSLLALAARYSSHAYFDGQSQVFAHKYGEIARGLIMFRIAQGTVKLTTIQSLCLLALANFVALDTHLAWLHIDLVNSLIRNSNMDIETNQEDAQSILESKRRVYYSIHLLNQLYSRRSMALNMLEDINKPKYVGSKQDPFYESSKPPPLTPRETLGEHESQRGGIWTYMVQQSSLWKEVRDYVARCADGNLKPPWSPDSGYAVIGAHLMDLETNFPTHYRYDAARFSERSRDELHRNREFWSPWLYLQFAYHAIHSVLNHPFLYSARPHQSIQLAVPNTFWKTSSELALLHSTWIVRLIEMVTEKEYPVSDPFIAHTAAVSATIHLYYCRAADSRVRTSAQTKLSKCMTFISDLGIVWPLCHSMYERLDTLIQSALGSGGQSAAHDASCRTVSIKTALMWDILDYTCPHRGSHRPGRGLFDPSLVQDQNNESDDEQTVETQIFHRPTAEADTSNGGQELPPYSDRAMSRNRARANHTSSNPENTEERLSRQPSVAQHPSQLHQSDIASWQGPAFLGNVSIMDITHDPFFPLQDHSSSYLGFWDSGNL